jgi:hypothetical protein
MGSHASLAVQSSCSLQHVPLDVQREDKLTDGIKSKLSFALQKLTEIDTLSRTPAEADVPLSPAEKPLPIIDPAMFNRPSPYPQRREKQFKACPEVCTALLPLQREKNNHDANSCAPALSLKFERQVVH